MHAKPDFDNNINVLDAKVPAGITLIQAVVTNFLAFHCIAQ